MEQVKRTNKYLRECLTKGLATAIKELPYIIKKYGYKSGKNSYQLVGLRPEFQWNHQLQGFYLTDGKVYVDIYWQGDSTDGDETELFSRVVNATNYGGEFVVPAEYYDADRYGVREQRHSPLRIDRDEVMDLIKALAEYISPSAIKARKEAELRRKNISDLKEKARTLLLNRLDKRYDHYWRTPEEHDNGKWAVYECIEKNVDVLMTYDDTKLTEVLNRVYDKNHKSSSALRKDICGPKVYDIAI